MLTDTIIELPHIFYFTDIEWMDEMETKYAKMNEHIKTVCQRYNTTGKTHVYRRRWLIDTTHNLAHCLRAKLGSTGWIHNFNSLLAKAEREEKRALIVGKYMQWFHINRRKRKPGQSFPDILKHDSIFTSTFTRHPFERLVSFFNRNVMEIPTYRKMSFPTFLDSIINGHHRSFSWKYSWKQCNFCFVTFDTIGRMETYDEDFRYIIIKYNISHLVPLQNSSKK